MGKPRNIEVGSEEGPPTSTPFACGPAISRSHLLQRRLPRGRALLQKRHSSVGVMNPAGNFENRDLMKRATWLMQGFELHSRMLAQSVRP